LVVVPSVVGRLLLGAELTGVSVVIGRVTGIALIGLGVACLPGRTALCGMVTYNALGAVYFAWLAFGGEWVGPLLWPAVVLHAVIAILLGRVWFQLKNPDTSNEQTRK
jgi:hypothetical protein